ncbi:MAG: guanylate kinase [Elusimicrobia bacterium]|nr:guanylate kinase [Elusimicrobiota bacterium]
MKEGLVVVLSGPSGCGKSTLSRLLMRRHRGIVQSVSVTTRPPRPGERDGRDYHFITPREFQRLIRRGRLAEWARVHGCAYGTPRRPLEAALKAGQTVLLDIDIQGGAAIKRQFPDAVLIFVMVPSLSVLKARLRQRGQDSPSVIQRRLKAARRELRAIPRYEYLLLNDHLPQALRRLEAILEAERCRVARKRVILHKGVLG